MRRAACAVALLASAIAFGDVVSDRVESVELTIYREPGKQTSDLSLTESSNGIAMITETRTIDIPAGTSVIQFRGVADALIPQTASLQGLPAVIVEANFDYNLLAPGTLIAKSLGRRVRLIRTNRGTGQVTERRGLLESGPNGVVLNFDGDIEALHCSGLDERLVFDDVPESLMDKPTLSMTVRAPQAGRHRVELSYLALGMDWSADYVARIHPDGRHLDLSGWITLVNRHGSNFSDARTHVVAGNLARVEVDDEPAYRTQGLQQNCWPIGEFRVVRKILAEPSEDFGRDRLFKPAFAPSDVQSVTVTAAYIAKATELGDYKLYTLPVPTNVAPRQMKQVRLLERSNVEFQRIYAYRIDAEELGDAVKQTRPRVVLRLENERKRGLGLPLPGGSLAVMQAEAGGRFIFAGENTFQDTPEGLPADIDYSEAMDVFVGPRVVEDETYELAGKEMARATIEVRLRNDKSVPIVLELRHSPERDGTRVLASSPRHTMKGKELFWSLRLPPGQSQVLTYTLEAPDE